MTELVSTTGLHEGRANFLNGYRTSGQDRSLRYATNCLARKQFCYVFSCTGRIKPGRNYWCELGNLCVVRCINMPVCMQMGYQDLGQHVLPDPSRGSRMHVRALRTICIVDKNITRVWKDTLWAPAGTPNRQHCDV